MRAGPFTPEFKAEIVERCHEGDRSIGERSGNIPLYPELRARHPQRPPCARHFTDVARHHLIDHGRVAQTFEPTFTLLQHQVLDLLGVSAGATPAPRPVGADNAPGKCGTSGSAVAAVYRNLVHLGRPGPLPG